MQQLAGVSDAQLRHWRKTLSPLMGRDGRADSYSFAEVVGLALVALLVGQLGVSVSQLNGCAASLFALLAEYGETGGWPDTVYLDAGGVVDVVPPTDGELVVLLHVARVVARLREQLAPELRAQLALPFVRVPRSRGGGG